jgi:hypothetical protein
VESQGDPRLGVGIRVIPRNPASRDEPDGYREFCAVSEQLLALASCLNASGFFADIVFPRHKQIPPCVRLRKFTFKIITMRTLIGILVLFSITLAGCNGQKQGFTQTENWLRGHCECGKVEGKVSPLDRGTLWEFVLEDCRHADNAAHSRSLLAGLEENVDGFCDFDAEISFTYYQDGHYDPHVYQHCFPAFQF